MSPLPHSFVPLNMQYSIGPSGMLTSGELARRFGVCPTTVNHLGRQGILKRHTYDSDHRYLYEPPGDVTLLRGAGSRYGGRPPKLMPVPPTARGAL